MSTITKEWLQQKIADMEAARYEIPFGLDEDDSNTLAALSIALASIEAEPVAWRHFQETPTDDGYWILNDYKPNCSGVEPLYTAPPAPVSVPDEMTPKQASRSYCGEVRGYRDGWNACRASMLQGAGGNSPVVQDGWVACSERMPDGMQTVITSNGFDIGQGWWDGDEWKQWSHHDAIPGVITHWMPLPAAPQQEAKNV